MQLYLGITPRDLSSASGWKQGFAHVAYRIGSDSTLLRQALPDVVRGGLLSVSDREAPEVQDPEALTSAALRECGRRNYAGVLLDFEAEPRRDLEDFVHLLGQALTRTHRSLYVPEPYGRCSDHAVVLINSAISGGTLSQRLTEASADWGAARIALDVQRLRMDFTLPARTGEGCPLSAGEFRALCRRENPAVFFSAELCGKYFSYSREGSAHFLLFDDADTLKRKLRLASSLDLNAAFLMWPEVADLFSELLR